MGNGFDFAETNAVCSEIRYRYCGRNVDTCDTDAYRDLT